MRIKLPFRIFRLITHEGSRDICVIDKQPFYRSTGKNSDLAGVWFLFEGFDKPQRGIPFFSKPNATNIRENEINDFFPDSRVAYALKRIVNPSRK